MQAATNRPSGGQRSGDAGARGGHQKSTSVSVSVKAVAAVLVLPARSVMPTTGVHVMFLAVTAVAATLVGVPSVTTIEAPSAERTMVEANFVVALT